MATKMTLSLTQKQWEACLEALSQFTENERCNDEYDDPDTESEHLTAAEEVLETLQAPLILSSGSKVLPSLGTSWKITPNRKRTSRRPKRTSRRPKRTSRRGR